MRARNIKPGFYENEKLVECSVYARLMFPGLWMMADRAGRLEDRPKRIKALLFPYEEIDCDPLLVELWKMGFIVRYEIGGERFIQVLNFAKHQNPHKNEKTSDIPEHSKDSSNYPSTLVITQTAPADSPSPDSPSPDSLNPDCVAARAKASTPFSKIYEAGSAVFPNLATANTAAIHAWIADGCDPDLDAVPEITRHAGKNVRSWSYFTGGIADAKATRLNPMPKGKPNGSATYQNKPSQWKSAMADLARVKAERQAERERCGAGQADRPDSRMPDIAEDVRQSAGISGDG